MARQVGRATEPPQQEAGVSTDPGDGRFCNPIGAVKRHLFTFVFVAFLCSAEERFFAPAYHVP
jgi:hypothetical protein